jgi:hypothetical protein
MEREAAGTDRARYAHLTDGAKRAVDPRAEVARF